MQGGGGVYMPVFILHLSTIRSRERLRRQSVRPFSASSTSRPQGTQGNIITRGGPSLRRRPGYVPCPGDRCMDGDGGWGPQILKRSKKLADGGGKKKNMIPNKHIFPFFCPQHMWSGHEEVSPTCPQHAVDGSLLSFRRWPAGLAGRAGVGGGGRRVWLRRQLWKRVAACD